MWDVVSEPTRPLARGRRARARLSILLVVAAILLSGTVHAGPGPGKELDPFPLLPDDETLASLCTDEGGDHLTVQGSGVLAGWRLDVTAVCAVDAEGPQTDTHDLPPCDSTAYGTLGHKWQHPPVFFPNPAGAPSGASNWIATSLIDSYAEMWSEHVPGSPFYLTSVYTYGLLGAPGELDATNLIGWSADLPDSTLGRAYIWSFSGVAVEADIAISSTVRWSANWHPHFTEFSWGSVLLHELGHVFGLDHVDATAANDCLVMYPYLAKGERFSPPRTGDILGIQSLYGSA